MSKILVKSADERFRRAGIEFTRAGVELDTKKLKKQQLDEINAEPRLSVSVVEADKPENDDKKGDDKKGDDKK